MEVRNMPDLWPKDIESPLDEPVPAAILQEQASWLGTHTKNLVKAEVVRYDPDDWGTDALTFTFFIVAPTLGRYRYELFTIKHGVSLYPVTIRPDEGVQRDIGATTAEIQADSREDFINTMTSILQSKTTKRIVKTLRSLATYRDIPMETDADLPF
jgi:hypothetical protein